MLAALFAIGTVAAVEAAPTDAVSQADLKALIERISKLEAENKAQAAKIAVLAAFFTLSAKGLHGGLPEETSAQRHGNHRQLLVTGA